MTNVGIFKFARHYFCRDLEEKGRKYIRHHFKRILQESPEFKELTSEELEAILRDDELNVKNEEIVFEAVNTWVEHNLEERKPYLPRLLKCVRYGLMSYAFFANDILGWKIVEEDQVSTRPTIRKPNKQGSFHRAAPTYQFCFFHFQPDFVASPVLHPTI